MNKKLREAVYLKYDGHCGYCGSELPYKSMQVDHIHAKHRVNEWKMKGVEIEHLDNYMPSCRRCNLYKDTFTIEQFRDNLLTLHERINKVSIFNIGVNFGMTESAEPFSGIFYFEKFTDIECSLCHKQSKCILNAWDNEYYCEKCDEINDRAELN